MKDIEMDLELKFKKFLNDIRTCECENDIEVIYQYAFFLYALTPGASSDVDISRYMSNIIAYRNLVLHN